MTTITSGSVICTSRHQRHLLALGSLIILIFYSLSIPVARVRCTAPPPPPPMVPLMAPAVQAPPATRATPASFMPPVAAPSAPFQAPPSQLAAPTRNSPDALTSIDFGEIKQPLRMNMSSSRDIRMRLLFNRELILAKGADVVTVTFKAQTISPQFNILSLDTSSARVSIWRTQLEASKYAHEISLRVHANYIGHAQLVATGIEFGSSITNKRPPPPSVSPLSSSSNLRLDILITQHEGVWGIIFLVCVSIFMLISYINLGAQLDEENLLQLIKQPKTLVLGFLIGALVMPTVCWFVGAWFLQQQPLYRIGSFIFAAGPAASASTLWTVMLNSDKELSVGLQVVSTIGALFTMPLLLYLMDTSLSLNNEISHPIQVPYARLIQTLGALLCALLIGWRFVGKNERAQRVSRKIFRPLIFSVLIFIIVFSSILYWHIYQMFDWNITLASLLITMLTYMISGVLGHCINCDLERAVAISIGSAYKNSGIAFAVLLVAFDAPDTFIAYVPCLTQIVITSITLYLTYLIVTLYNFVRRRGQPDAIQADKKGDDEEAEAEAEAQAQDGQNKLDDRDGARQKKRRGSRDKRRASTDKTQDEGKNLGPAANQADDADEFIAMNLTDIDPSHALPSSNQDEDQQQQQQQPQENPEQLASVKVVRNFGANDDEFRQNFGTRV